MTTTAIGRPARADRRAKLLTLISRATEELIALERADRRTPTIDEPRNVELIPYNDLRPANRTARVRKWALSNGWPDLAAKGPIPRPVHDAYTAANPEDTP